MMDIKKNDNYNYIAGMSSVSGIGSYYPAITNGGSGGTSGSAAAHDKNSYTRTKSPVPSIISTNNILTMSEYTNNNNPPNFNKSNDGSS
jgi:hypothetical protein